MIVYCYLYISSFYYFYLIAYFCNVLYNSKLRIGKQQRLWNYSIFLLYVPSPLICFFRQSIMQDIVVSDDDYITMPMKIKCSKRSHKIKEQAEWF